MLSTVRRLFTPQDQTKTDAPPTPEEFPGAAEHDREIAAATSRRDQARDAASKEREAHALLTAAVTAAKNSFEADPTDDHYDAVEAANRQHAKGAVFLSRALKLAADAQAELDTAENARKQALIAHLTELAAVGPRTAQVDQIWAENGAAAVDQLARTIAEIEAVLGQGERAAQRLSQLVDGDKQTRLDTGAIGRTSARMNELRLISNHVRRRFRQELAGKLDGVGGLSRWIDQ